MIFEGRIDDYLKSQAAGANTEKENFLPRMQVVTPAAADPVTLADVKAFLRIDNEAENALITGLLKSAATQCEAITGRAFITRTLRAWYDSSPARSIIELAHTPVASITEIISYDSADAPTTMSSAGYFLDEHSLPPRVALRSGYAWPTGLRVVNGFSILYEAGYGAADTDVPDGIKEAIKLLCSHYYEGRDSQKLSNQNTTIGHVPDAVRATLMPFIIKPLGE